MFNINRLDFLGTDEFDNILDKLFSGCRIERTRDEDGISRARVFLPKMGDSSTARDKDFGSEPTWRKEVRIEAATPAVDFPTEDIKPKVPKSLLEMLEDGDVRLEKLLGDIIDKKLDERHVAAATITPSADDREAEVEFDEYEDDEEDEVPEDVGSAIDQPSRRNPSVFIANRLTFLVQSMFPLVFDTSLIETGTNSMTIAVNREKTFPKLNTHDDLGFITSQVNSSPSLQKEIAEYLDGTDFSNIYCFPSTIVDMQHNEVLMAVKFVVYPKRKYVNF